MKRLHVNLAVKNMEESLVFYKNLFDSDPAVLKEDYAKWMLDDPFVNFSISIANRGFGVAHLGMQVEGKEELQQVYARFESTRAEVLEEGHTICCYSQSEKSWVTDPQGVEWEAFHTYGESEVNKTENGPCCDDSCCS